MADDQRPALEQWIRAVQAEDAERDDDDEGQGHLGPEGPSWRERLHHGRPHKIRWPDA